MPTDSDDFIVRRLRFNTAGQLVDESCFATERELAGIKEEQAALPLEIPPTTEPLETAGPLLTQHKEGDTT
jgi:hypothetical protein